MLQSGIDFGKIFGNLYESMGFVQGNWQNYVMLLISFVLMFLAVVKNSSLCSYCRLLSVCS